MEVTRNAPAVLAMKRLYLAGQNVDDDGIFVWSRRQGEGWSFDSPDMVGVPSVGTSDGPALVANPATFVWDPDKLLMFWKGMDDDHGIWHSTSVDDGHNWTTQQSVPNVGTSYRPALAASGENVYAIWKGLGGDGGLYWAFFSTFTGASTAVWLDPLTHNPVRPGERHIPNVGTSHRPAMAVLF